MEVDVVVVGAGPSGLAAAIRIKQLDQALSVVVLEKGAEVGAHILSGAVIDPIGIDALLPDWRADESCPISTPVTTERFLLLGKTWSVPVPSFLMPPLMSNHGNYVVSLGSVCRWLAAKAESLGVEVYPGFAAREVVYGGDGRVVGITTGDMGVLRNGSRGPSYVRGMELHGKYVLIAEGVRGSLAGQLIERFGLDEHAEPPKYGIGIKELWEVRPENHRPGLIQHTLGWPLGSRTGGGSFLYHLDGNRVALGFIVHLNYENPYLSPFDELQRVKLHPAVRPTLEGGTRIAYGARAISEGGYQSVPKLTFPGGVLLGCSAGMVNVPRIKGSHNAILSGMLAAEAAVEAIAAGRSQDELARYDNEWREGPVGRDLKLVRNVKPLWSRFGALMAVALGGFDMWVNQLTNGWSPFGTMRHGAADYESLKPAGEFAPIEYPKPDGQLTFDKMSSVFLSGTHHEEDQPVHLQVLDIDLQSSSEFGNFGGPSMRYCPAGVYEWIDEHGSAIPPQQGHRRREAVRFQINAQNCVHCKACDIKDPNQNIVWIPPQGGDGPLYQGM